MLFISRAAERIFIGGGGGGGWRQKGHSNVKKGTNQLGTFFVNGEWACSLFVTKSGHADNPAIFATCVKSMTADFISQNIQCSPRGIAL